MTIGAMEGECSLIDSRTEFILELHPHTCIRTIQDGVTADEVAEVHGHQAVCDELRKNVRADRRPLSQVRSDVDMQFCRANGNLTSTLAR